jgi:hypothetical protein
MTNQNRLVMSKKKHSPNDRRAIVKNPNNEQFDLDKLNTEKQLKAEVSTPKVKTKQLDSKD